jgi:tRNA synthetases class II core domain (F)
VPGWSGLALGLGLDRLLMVRKGIPDIRLLRSTDPRIAGQMADLAPWRPVSAMPPVRRDLSVAVAADDTVEDLGDRVRDALGPDADAVEEVTVLAETASDRLPAKAIARAGDRPPPEERPGPGGAAPPGADADRRGGEPDARPRLLGPAPWQRPPVGGAIAIEDPTAPSTFA